MQPWAHRFVTLRRDLYDDVLEGLGIDEETKSPNFQDQGNHLPPRGSELHLEQMIYQAAQKLLQYFKQQIPSSPSTYMSRQARRQAIRDEYARGSTLWQIANKFGISAQRVHQIVTGTP